MPRAKNTKRADGRLQSKIYVGNGKYKYVYADTQRELDKKVNEVKIALGKGLDVSAERDTFGDWAERWLKLKEAEVSHGRYQSYKYRIDGLSYLHKMQITKIRNIDIQDIILDKAKDGCSEKTLKEYKSVCSQIFKLAISNRVIDFNPAADVKIPSVETYSDRRALTEEERSWITAPSDHRGKTAAMIMMFAGLRRGELIALTWRDIDLDSKTITVNKAVEMVDGKSVLKNHTKTDAGMRTVYIPQILTDYLKTQDKGTSLHVCPDAKGGMMSESAWKRLWNSYLAELNFRFGDFSHEMVTDENGKLTQFKLPKSRFAPKHIPMVIPRFTAHWLRHTFITMMYFAGVDVLTAKEQAGHADIQTTMEIYTHLDGKYKTKQIQKLDDYINSADGCQMGVK